MRRSVSTLLLLLAAGSASPVIAAEACPQADAPEWVRRQRPDCPSPKSPLPSTRDIQREGANAPGAMRFGDTEVRIGGRVGVGIDYSGSH